MKYKKFDIKNIFSRCWSNVYFLCLFYSFIYFFCLQMVDGYMSPLYIVYKSGYFNVTNETIQNIYVIFSNLTFTLIFYFILRKVYRQDKDKIKFYFTFSTIVALLYLMSINIFGNLDIIESNFRENFILTISWGVKSGSTGIMEEFFFRGLLLRHVLKNRVKDGLDKTKQIMFSVFIVSVIFGLFHLINLLHNSVGEVIPQMIYTFFWSLMFGLIYVLSNKSIVTISIFHFLLNFTGNLYGRTVKEEVADAAQMPVIEEVSIEIEEIFIEIIAGSIITFLYSVLPFIVSVFLYRKLKKKSNELDFS